ncbi:MAG: hypothetical protein L0Y58_12920, partial [Verrucomicrobia subdivision 3 bacterium]|nr:hypothetical protein [Limisphaerales bacterium]
MQKKVDRLPPGTRHSIHHNPAAPGEIEYNASYSFEFFGIPLFCGGMGLIFALVGARATGLMGAPRRSRSNAHRCPACSQYIPPGQTACPNCGAPLPSTCAQSGRCSPHRSLRACGQQLCGDAFSCLCY